MTDAFMRYCELFTLIDKFTSSVTKTLKDNILDRHCTPKVLVYWDEFNNQLLEICHLYQIQEVNIMAANGLTACLNRKVLDCLLRNPNPLLSEGNQCISDVQCALNCTFHESLVGILLFLHFVYLCA